MPWVTAGPATDAQTGSLCVVIVNLAPANHAQADQEDAMDTIENDEVRLEMKREYLSWYILSVEHGDRLVKKIERGR